MLNKKNRKLIKTALKGLDDARLLRICKYEAQFVGSYKGCCSFIVVDFIEEFVHSFYMSSSKAEVIYDYATRSYSKYWRNIYKQDKFERYGVKYGL